jgi:phosphoribosyl-ATP pyrophosphohydrolase/phosphoribosyl-AMP cyclohydrolase
MVGNVMNSLIKELNYGDNGLIPVIVQHFESGTVLMMAYMNKEALEKSLETGRAHYWSRSRNKLWQKGETSGHFQYIKSISVDCDLDTLLIKVDQKEAACHTGHYSCFYRNFSLSKSDVVSSI